MLAPSDKSLLLTERWELLLLFLTTGEVAIQPIDNQRIMNGMFLLEMKGGLGTHSYHFEPHTYGPFSKQVHRDVDILQGRGYIDMYWRVTTEGMKVVNAIVERLPKETRELVRQAQDDIWNKGFVELLQSIYKQYPQYAVKYD